jgi:hypothetical protein
MTKETVMRALEDFQDEFDLKVFWERVLWLDKNEPRGNEISQIAENHFDQGAENTESNL